MSSQNALLFLIAFVQSVSPNGSDQPKGPYLVPGTPARQMEALKDQLESARAAAKERIGSEPVPIQEIKAPIQGQTIIVESRLNSNPYYELMLKIATDHPKDTSLFSGLIWIFDHASEKHQAEAAKLLISNHLMNEKIVEFFERALHSRWPSGNIPTTDAMRLVKGRHPNTETRGKTAYYLAQQLFEIADKARVANLEPAQRLEYANWFKDAAEEARFKKFVPKKLEDEACQLLEE